MIRLTAAARVFTSVGLTAALLLLPALSHAQVQNKDEQTCINTMNKSGAKVAATQGKENSGCIKGKATGKLVGTVDACLVADGKGKVQKAEDKTAGGQSTKCGDTPDFAFTNAATVNASAIATELELTTRVFGSPVDPAIQSGTVGSCQSNLAKSYEKYGATRAKEFNSCKKGALATANDPTDLLTCITSDAKGKVQKAADKILTTIDSKCADFAPLSNAVPGPECNAQAATSGDLRDCLVAAVDCQMCKYFEESDNLDADCDTIDDGAVNQSCRQCQNGATEAPEQCDDGAESAACDTDCTFAVCGDGTTNASVPEACDDSGQSATCDDDCTAPACGDGNLNEDAGEVCDDSNLVDGDGCDSNCTITACGNNIVTAPEICDDGDLTNGDGCDANCTPTGCGNGIVTAGETCDDNNLIDGDGCDSNCTPTGCGNNITTAPETCDTGGESITCDDDCTAPACHDGNHNAAAGEACDDGDLDNTDSCVGLCVLATCGDGFLCSSGGCTTGPTGGTEQCDDDGANSNVTPDACRLNCANPSCGDNVTDTGEFCDTGGNSLTCDANCTAAACGDGFTNPAANEDCDTGGESMTCDIDCTDVECGDDYVNTVAGEECEDGNTENGDGCSDECTCGLGSGEVGCQDDACATKGELTLLAATGHPCTTNGDCYEGSTCDLAVNGGRCVTETELDTGWTGIAHDADINHEVVVVGDLVCPGPASPTCGECVVTGLEPDPGYCRCNNDHRAVCDEPFETDADDCGGAMCDCYFGAPLGLSSGNTPACVVNRFANDISGTANVDTGEGQVDADLASVVYLGIDLDTPCPVCGGTCTDPPSNSGDFCGRDVDCDSESNCNNNGDCTNPGGICEGGKCRLDGVCANYDPTPNDGNRGGRCFGGDDNGDTCDVGAVSTTFTEETGAGYSLDCRPGAANNVSGTGLKISLSQTTGTASLLPAGVICGFPPSVPLSCPCGRCSLDTSIACNSNADCTGGTGTCGNASGSVQPNQCDDGVCSPTGNNEGECSGNALPDKFCDAVTRSNGEGFIQCNGNADCSATNIGIIGGNCTLTKLRECFLDPITATGTEDANTPLGVAAFCIPATSNPAINTVAGLPGPGRVRNQAFSRIFCHNNLANEYEPGVGCP